MKALKINTEKRTIIEVQIKDWREIAPGIGNGCTTFSCPVELKNGDTIFCDDDGLSNPYYGGWIMDGWDYPLVGNALIIGADRDGNSIDCKTSLEDMRIDIIFLTIEDLIM